MGMVTIKKQSGASVPLPDTDNVRLFCTPAGVLSIKDNNGDIFPSGVDTAGSLDTTVDPVDVALSAPPIAGGILTADTATEATWKDPATVNLYGSPVRQTAVQVGPTTYIASFGDLVRVDVSGGLVTVDLPAAAGGPDREVWIKLTTTADNDCVANPDGAETIDGASDFTLDTDYEWIILRSDGANWMQVG